MAKIKQLEFIIQVNMRAIRPLTTLLLVLILYIELNTADMWPPDNHGTIPGNNIPGIMPNILGEVSLSISGPNQGRVGKEYEYCISISDPDPDKYDYEITWDYGVSSPVIPTLITFPGTHLKFWRTCASHTWTRGGTYPIGATAQKRAGSGSHVGGPLISSDPITVTIIPNSPPAKPTFNGDNIGYVEVSYSFAASVIDPDGDQVYYKFDWGDGSANYITELVDSGTEVTVSHSWMKEGTYNVRVMAADSMNADSVWSRIIKFRIIKNHPPTKPSWLSGPNSGNTGIYYDYTAMTTDPDWGKLSYTFDWDDESQPTKTDQKDSGRHVTASHAWSDEGIYNVRVMATDVMNAESEWSDTMEVCIKENHPPEKPFWVLGPESGSSGIYYNYSASAHDPDGDRLDYIFYWGDGNTFQKIPQYPGKKITIRHMWEEDGIYSIKVMARDGQGATSDWSEPKVVEIKTNRPPNKPSKPSGPTICYAGTSYNYSITVSDPDYDQLMCIFDWDDGTTSDTGYILPTYYYVFPRFHISPINLSHTWTRPGEYKVKVTAADINKASSEPSDTLAVTVKNTESIDIKWKKCLGSKCDSHSNDIHQTDDGGYILVGDINTSDLKGYSVGYDILVAKTDDKGNLSWQKYYGGRGNDIGYSILQAINGEYIVAGETNSIDLTGGYGDSAVYISKLDISGNIKKAKWPQLLGGNGYNRGYCIRQIGGAGYIVAGDTSSNDLENYHGGYDAWVSKIDSNGNIIKQKCFGGSGNDHVYNIRQTANNGYILIGRTSSNDGDLKGITACGSDDIWVIKLDSDISIQWQKCFGGKDSDHGQSIEQTSDGGFILVGYTKSSSINRYHGLYDLWVAKLSDNGEIQWEYCFGGTGNDYGASVQETFNGNYLIAGSTDSNNGDVNGNHGSSDVWVIMLDSDGTLLRQRCLGGSAADDAKAIERTKDNEYILLGDTNSEDGDIDDNHNRLNAWLVMLESVD